MEVMEFMIILFARIWFESTIFEWIASSLILITVIMKINVELCSGAENRSGSDLPRREERVILWRI